MTSQSLLFHKCRSVSRLFGTVGLFNKLHKKTKQWRKTQTKRCGTNLFLNRHEPVKVSHFHSPSRKIMAHTSDLPLTSQGTAGISGPK